MLTNERKDKLSRFLKMNNLETSDFVHIDFGLTHPSFTNFHSLPYTANYERYEFLGDAVLKLVASKYLFNSNPEAHEGKLTQIRSVLVSDACLEVLAKNLGLEKLIELGNVEFNCQKLPSSILACAFEGLLGALYLTCKYEKIEKFLIIQFDTIIEQIKSKLFCLNAKALLQEFTQGQNKDLPKYVLLSEFGPEHKKTFEIGVFYHDELLAAAEGKTKKEAQQNAAAAACKKLGILEE